MISEKTVVNVSENQVHTVLDGESVILDLEEGIYYGLDEVGTRIWELLQEPTEVLDVIDTLTKEYDVTRDKCTSDTLHLLEDLQEHNLIDVQNSEIKTANKRE